MKIQYASDLHLEFRENTRYLKEHPLEVVGDILVLAGDILLFGEKLLSEHPFWDWCSDHYTHTFIVPGNHEYYNRVDVLSTLTNFTYPLRKNVTYVNNRSITIGDTELFFTTLWSRISDDALAAVQMGMNDCHRIAFGDHILLATDYARAHDKCLNWLKDALSKSTALHKVVITHHCPIIAEARDMTTTACRRLSWSIWKISSSRAASTIGYSATHTGMLSVVQKWETPPYSPIKWATSPTAAKKVSTSTK